MLLRHVSGTEQKGVVTLDAESGAANDEGGDLDHAPVSSVSLLGLCASFAIPEAGCTRGVESERRRLINDIMRLLANSAMPEATRVAGLTLIGWLARRRIDEEPHSLGISEARESERRVRAKAR
jgi:hypothetical protein